jgi:hypothetical protein
LRELVLDLARRRFRIDAKEARYNAELEAITGVCANIHGEEEVAKADSNPAKSDARDYRK